MCCLGPVDLPGLSHELILHPKKHEVETYITLKWKPPSNSTGIYSYQIVSIATLSTDWCGKRKVVGSLPIKHVILYDKHFTILMEGDVLETYLTTGFIMTKPRKIRDNAEYSIFIFAKNMKGTAEAVARTKCEFVRKCLILFKVFFLVPDQVSFVNFVRLKLIFQ